MHGPSLQLAARAAVLGCSLSLLACAPQRATRLSARPRVTSTHRTQVCEAPAIDATRVASSAAADAAVSPQGSRVQAIDVEGARTIPPAMILAAMETRPGMIVDRAELEKDVQRLEALGTLDAVHLAWTRRDDGLALTVRVRERPIVGALYEAPGSPPLGPGLWVPPLPGDLYDPVAIERAREALEHTWRAKGYADARAAAHALRVSDERMDVCIDLDIGPAWLVDRIDVVGASSVPAHELRERIDTKDGAFNAPGKPYRADLLREDVERMTKLLRDRGVPGGIIGTPRVTWIRARSAVAVEIPVYERRARAAFEGVGAR